MANSEFLEVQENGLSIGLATPAPEFLLTPNIGVIGVGGAGGNAINNMVTSDLGDVSFFAANTDAQALSKSLVADKIQLGVTITQGLGAGANPEVGRAAATEASEKIKEYLKGLHLLFITAGMGGGTGTGAAPVIAKLAKDMGILTVGVVSKPFQFEGARRMRIAEAGIEELKKYVDTLIVIPNQNLFRIVASNTTFVEAFKIADGVLCQGVRSITDIVMNPGGVNSDFADVKTILSSMGRAMMGTGEASGENRATIAVEQAISNPLLDDSSIQGAKSVLINISGGMDLTLTEVDSIMERIRQELHQEEANIIFGMCTDEALHGRVRVSLIATGIDEDAAVKYVPPVQQATETIVNVPTSSETAEADSLSVTESESDNLSEAEEPFPLMSDIHEPVEHDDTILPIMQLDDDHALFDETPIPEMAIELTEAPTTQPPLFVEEVPEIAPIIPINEMPEVKESINMESKKADANVKAARSSLFDIMLPGFIGKAGRRKVSEPMSSESQSMDAIRPVNLSQPAASKMAASGINSGMYAQNDTARTKAAASASNELFDDSYENVDLPAFLRRK